MEDRIEIGDAESNLDDALEGWFYGGKILVSVENPWAGSTETGFGYTCQLELTAAQARKLADWLNALADKNSRPNYRRYEVISIANRHITRDRICHLALLRTPSVHQRRAAQSSPVPHGTRRQSSPTPAPVPGRGSSPRPIVRPNGGIWRR